LYQKAAYYYTRAAELDPFYIENYRYQVRCYRILGEFDKAIASMKEMLEIEPEDSGLKIRHARLLIWMGEYIEAEEIIASVEEADPTLLEIKYPRALSLAVRGKKNEALALIQSIESYYFSTLITNVYAALGMKEDVFRMIEDGIENGYARIQTHLFTYQYLKNNPFFDILRQDTRFQKILKSEKERYDKLLRQYRDL